MPRMTPELLLSNNSYLNPLKDRELNLRGYQIPAIENLGVTKDSLDAIDLTDNSIRSLINLPKLNRLKHLYLSNNPISFISPNLSQSIPNLNSLVLTNCNLSNLNQVFSVLKNFRRLEILVLTGNPICKVKLYRDWCIFTCPKVRILDYIRVKDKERRTAKELFYDATSKSLTPLAQSLSIVDPTGPVDPDHQLSLNNQQSQNVEPGQLGQKLTAEERERIKDSIEKASSVEEVRRLKRMLDQGFIPKEPRKPVVVSNNEDDTMDVDVPRAAEEAKNGTIDMEPSEEVQKDASKEEEQPKETPSKEPKKSIKKRSPSKRQKK
ncbi:leucine-rich repeat-domain-containing protein [Phakopsora pachyrhizi]|uniref:U2 small nuclear ribonucleoprotein A' n=1 Tax=Phakopsora pachyrhizi TaxID=170000 RepID=A0AAV0AJM8_PHAPC|nr:leucine-rich repeat-domain-containing protein [Phakopsora pachyrhizi]